MRVTSLIKTLGVQNLQKIFLLRNLISVLTFAFCDGIASIHIDAYSTTKNIYSFGKEDDNGPIKSISQQ